MIKTAEEKMFWILLMVGADILAGIKSLQSAAGIDDDDDDADPHPTFDHETLRIAAYDQRVDDLYAIVELADASLDLPPDVEPLTALAVSYLGAIRTIALDGHDITTNEAALARQRLRPLFSGVCDNLPLDARMRFLIVHSPRFSALLHEPYVTTDRDPAHGRPEADYRTMLDACKTVNFSPAVRDENGRIAFYNELSARITANPVDAPMDPAVARSMFMKG